MAKNNKILEKDIIEDKVYKIGDKFGKSLEPGIKGIEKFEKQWLESIDKIKKATLEQAELSKQFDGVKSGKGYVETKNKQIIATDKLVKAMRGEQRTFTAYTNERIKIEKQLISTTNQVKLAEQGRTDALVKQRYERQQLTKRAKEAAVISSKLSTEYEKQSVRLDQLRRRYKDVALTEGEASNKAKKLREEIHKLDGTLKRVDANVGQFQRSVGNYGKAMQSAAGAGRAMMSAMGAVGGAYLFVNVMRDAFKTVVEFDRQLIAVKKTTNLSSDGIKKFSKEVVNLGLKLKGVSIQGLLKSSEIAGQLGIRGTANILKFSKTLEQLKLTSDIAGEESARNFAKFIEVSSDSVENADRLGSVITELGNNFATTESQILKNTIEIQKGISIYDTTAQSVIGLGAATNALGNEAEATRGAMQTAFKVLNDGATTGKGLEKILKLTGQTASEFRKEFGENSVETFRKFVNGLSESEKEGKNLSNTLTDLGITEKRATTVIGSLAKNYNVLEDALNKANTEYQVNEALTKEVLEASQSLESKMLDVSDAWDGVVLSFENGSGPISKAFKSALGFVEKLLIGVRMVNSGEAGLLADLTSNAKDRAIKDLTENVKLLGTTIEEEAEISISNSEAKIKSIKDEIAANELLIAQKPKIYDGSLGMSERGKLNNRIKEAEKSQKGLNRNLATYTCALQGAKSLIEQVATETEAETDATTKQTEAEIRANSEREKSNKLYQARLKLLKDDKFSYAKAQLESEIEAEKNMSENQKESYGNRQVALIQFFNAKKELLEIQRDFEIAENQGRADKLAEIELKYEDDIIAINQDKQAKQLELLKQHFETELKVIQDAKQAQIDAQDSEILEAQNVLNNSNRTPEDVENYEKLVSEIKKRYALDTIQAQIDAINAIDKTGFTVEQVEELEKQKAQLKITYSNIATDNIIENIEKQKEAEEKLLEFKKQSIASLSDGLSIALNIDAENINVFLNSLDTLFDGTQSGIENTLNTISAAAEVTRDIVSSVHQANIEELQTQLDKSNEYYDNQFERAEGDKVQQDLIREEQRIKEKNLKKKIAKEKEKAAKADKAAALVQIGVSTALGVVRALAEIPKIDFGISASLFAGFIAATGAAQMALVASKKIPKFKDGHLSGTYQGWAITNDGEKNGRTVQEVHERNGKATLIQGKNTPIFMKRGDKIHKSVEDYENLMRASILSSVEIDNNKLKAYSAEKAYQENDKALREEMALTRLAIAKSKTNVVVNQTKPLDIAHELYKLRSIE